MISISFKNFTFKYDSLKKPTIKNISLDINQGEKILIAGPSGSGKSTLAHCINGLIPFSYKGDISGKLTVKDIIPYEKSIYEISDYVGTILQDQDGQFVGLSVGEDVAFSYENNKTSQDVMFKGVEEALKAVDMLSYINETPHNLSGGQKQRVSLAGILATQGDILLFDEPLANLDPMSGKRAMEVIDEIHKKTNKTIIIVEHRIEDVLEYGVDRVIVMNNGEIIADDTPDNILKKDILEVNGLREPLYIEAIKKAGVNLENFQGNCDIKNFSKFSNELNILYKSYSKDKNICSKEKVVEVKDVFFRYYKDSTYNLKNINFNICKGEALAILGNNGAGKSTLLKVIAGIAKNEKGHIFYKGKNIDGWSVRKRAEVMGYVMQNPNNMIIKDMIFDEVAFGLRNFGKDEAFVKEKVDETLKVCGLYQYRNWPVAALSFGQKKRLTIASILAMDPEIIILDEPTAGQDYRNYKEFMGFLDRIKKQGISIVMITHDMHLALEYADRAIVLSGGEIIKEDSMFNVLSNKDILERANLKETSLTKIARICKIEDVEKFIYSYIDMIKGGELNE